jgi:predicted dehydrogenase
MVNLHVSWLSPRKVRDITIVGEKGMLTFDDMNLAEPLRLYDKQVTDQLTPAGFVDTFASFRTSIHEGDIQIPKVAAGEPLKAECDHFLACVASGKPPISGGRSGAGAVRVLDALSRSLRNGGRKETV